MGESKARLGLNAAAGRLCYGLGHSYRGWARLEGKLGPIISLANSVILAQLWAGWAEVWILGALRSSCAYDNMNIYYNMKSLGVEVFRSQLLEEWRLITTRGTCLGEERDFIPLDESLTWLAEVVKGFGSDRLLVENWERKGFSFNWV